MVLYELIENPKVDALQLKNGDYLYLKDGEPVTLSKAEFEAKYRKSGA
ncbi:MAG: hypothetical protein ABFC78_09800 [Methanoregula sp.]|jgi:hypothetical protein